MPHSGRCPEHEPCCPGVLPGDGTWAEGGVGIADGDLRLHPHRWQNIAPWDPPMLTSTAGVSDAKLQHFSLDWN